MAAWRRINFTIACTSFLCRASNELKENCVLVFLAHETRVHGVPRHFSRNTRKFLFLKVIKTSFLLKSPAFNV